MNSVGPESIAVVKGPAGLREAVTERLEEQTGINVLQNQLIATLQAEIDSQTQVHFFLEHPLNSMKCGKDF